MVCYIILQCEICIALSVLLSVAVVIVILEVLSEKAFLQFLNVFFGGVTSKTINTYLYNGIFVCHYIIRCIDQ